MSALIERLEKRLKKIQKSLKNGVDSDQIIALSSHESGFLTAFNIVKQHQAESGWVACSERMPSENELVLLYAISAKAALPNHWDIGTRFKVKRTYYNSNVEEVFWQPLPQPPSEVQP